jgi:hypothetical protein
MLVILDQSGTMAPDMRKPLRGYLGEPNLGGHTLVVFIGLAAPIKMP